MCPNSSGTDFFKKTLVALSTTASMHCVCKSLIYKRVKFQHRISNQFVLTRQKRNRVFFLVEKWSTR